MSYQNPYRSKFSSHRHNWRLQRHVAKTGASSSTSPASFQAKSLTNGHSSGGDFPRHPLTNGDNLLLHPVGDAVANSSFASSASSFRGVAQSPERFSRSSSFDGSFDGIQDRFLHTVYRVSFGNDKRVKERPTNVVINNTSFLLSERYVTGHSDGVYSKSKKLWEYVPLGQLRVFLNHSASSKVSTPVCAPESGTELRVPTSPNKGAVAAYTPLVSLCGLRKFAHWGEASSNIFNVSKEVPVSVVALEKVDGERGHVAAFEHEGERYWVVGGKDRHLLVRLFVPDDDLDAYVCEQPGRRSSTDLAKRVALVWRQTLTTRLKEEEVVELHEVMSSQQWTLCFDAVLYGWEHLVDYSGGIEPMLPKQEGLEKVCTMPFLDVDISPTQSPVSSPRSPDSSYSSSSSSSSSLAAHFENDSMWFYAVTFDEVSEKKGLCLPVEAAFSFFRRYHLPAVPRTGTIEMDSAEYATLRRAVTSKMNSAGAVFYGSNAAGLVVRLWKCRCETHVLERSAQELIATHLLQGALLCERLQKKLSNLPKATRACSLVWEKERFPFLVDFAAWLHATRQLTPSTDPAALREMRNFWITAQQTYTQEKQEHKLPYFASHSSDASPGSPTAADHNDDAGDDEEGPSPTDVILLVGPQGCGKSTLARALFSLIEQSGGTPRWFNQDEMKDRRAYLSGIRHAVEENTYTHIILDKMNLNHNTRADYDDIPLKIVLVVAWKHSGGADALTGVCFERVRKRGDNHRTFRLNASANSSVVTSPVHSPTSDTRNSAASGDDGSFAQSDKSAKRVRDIIRQSADAYEPPSDNACLELDITLNINTTVRRVWEALQERGYYELRPLSELSAEDAFKVAFRYEDLVSRYPRKVAIAALQCSHPEKVFARVSAGLIDNFGKKRSDAVQCVLHNFVEEPNPAALVHYADFDGSAVAVRPRKVVSDGKATILVTSDPSLATVYPRSLNGPSPALVAPDGQQRFLFMVLSKAKKVAMKYCRELAERVVSGDDDPYWKVETVADDSALNFTYKLVCT